MNTSSIDEVYTKVTFMKDRQYAFINDILYRKYDHSVSEFSEQDNTNEKRTAIRTS